MAGFPVYSRESKRLKLREIVEICFGMCVKEEEICKKVPRLVTEDAIFVIDLEAVNHQDLTCDDLGIYGSHASPSQFARVILDDSMEVTSVIPVAKANADTYQKDDLYIIRRYYSWHKVNGMARTVIKIQKDDSLMRFAIIQYKSSNFTGLKALSMPHGNAKQRKEAFVRTKPSVLEKVRAYGSASTPKQIISKIQNEAGGVMGLESESDVPRDRQQVYCALQKVPLKPKHRNTGPSKVANYGQLITLMNGGKFVKDVSFSVKTRDGSSRTQPSTFAATDTHITWIKNFCNGQSPQAQVGIDMTYNIGPFYLTALTFPHPMFVYKRSPKKHPTIFLGMMTSTSRDSSDYEYLGASMRRQGVSTLTYGTDGEAALEIGLENVFPIENTGEKNTSIHLRCFEHVKQDLLRVMKEMKLPDDQQSSVIASILGREKDGVRIKGLVDVEEKDFDSALQQLRKTLPERIFSWITCGQGRLRPLSETIRKSMLQSVRTKAGLGKPASQFVNQRSEAFNTVLKEETKKIDVDQVKIHEIIEERVVNQQRDEIIKSIYGIGEYRLAKDYQHFAKEFTDWAKMTSEQKDAHVDKVLRHKPKQTRALDASLTNCIKSLEIQRRLASVITKQEAEYIVRKTCSLSEEGSVLPLQNNKYCVTEKDNAFVVERKSTTSFFCSCRTFKANHIACPHVIFVTFECGELDAFVKKLENDENLPFKIMEVELPQQRGQKPGSKARRGKNNIQATPVTELKDGTVDIGIPRPTRFTQYYHNDEPFEVVFVKDHPRARKCAGCGNDIPRAFLTIPFDIVFSHKERYQYPKKDERGQVTSMEVTKAKMARRFYCVRKQCVIPRHPYFWNGRISLSKEVKQKLHESHFKYLLNELQFKP